ncbi:MAG: nucleoside deaminase, partial [Cyanobacteria bacterium J06607_15]
VSAHGEINALRAFTKKYGYALDTLTGHTLYTTCEPCPMCAAACVWAGVSTIVFGASTQQLIELGTKQIEIDCQTVANNSFQKIEVIGGILAAECLQLFKQL